MIRVSILYPLEPDKHFDLEYYCGHHLPLLRSLLGSACRNVALERGLAGFSVMLDEEEDMPDLHGIPVTITHLYFDTEESFQRATAPHAHLILADQANYTDIVPLVRVEEVADWAGV